MTTPEEELAQILGGGGPSPEDELAGILGGGKHTFKPWSGPQQIPATPSSSAGHAMWGTQNDPNADWLDKLAEGASDGVQRGAMSATMGWGDEIAGAMPEWAGGGDATRDAIRNRVQLAKERSPTASVIGDIGGSAVPVTATALATGGGSLAALPFAGRLAAGFGTAAEQGAIAAAGYADDGDRWQAAKDAAPLSGLLGAGGEAVASGVQGVGNAMQNKVAPWFRDQGLLNRAASTGRPVEQLSKELGGRQGVIDAGQWMENNGMTQWSPNKLNENLQDYTSMRTGDQRNFLDELAQNPDAYPVNTGQVANDLSTQGDALDQLAASSAQTQGGQYSQEAQNLMSKAPDGTMPFEQAWQNRQAFDTGAKWQRGAAGDQGLAEVNRDAANGLRSAMGDALDNTSPELRPRWDSIQGDLSNSLTLSGAGDANAAQLGIANIQAPLGLRSMAAAAGGGFPGYAAAVAAQSGGRGAAASAMGGLSRAAGSIDGSIGGPLTQGASQMRAQRYGEQQGVKESRGYLLPQAAQQLMSQSPQDLGPYQQQFFDTYKDPDSNALSSLITKLSHTDPQFKMTILPKLQQLTAESY